MTAIEELRRLLDEREVEWCDQSDEWEWQISWSSPAFGLCIASHMNRKDADMELSLPFLTPEQAVEATLGPGTCEVKEYESTGIPVCSECGAVQPEDYTVYYCWCCGRKVE